MDETNNSLSTGGVSRSGRIRKKSSKLVDYESPDERIFQLESEVRTHTSINKGSTNNYTLNESAFATGTAQAAVPSPVEELPPAQLLVDDLGGSSSCVRSVSSSFGIHEENLGMKQGDFVNLSDIMEDENTGPSSGMAIEMTNETFDDDEDEAYCGNLLIDDSVKKHTPKKNSPQSTSMNLEESSRQRHRPPHSAFTLWAEEARLNICRQNVGLNESRIAKALGEQWNKLDNISKNSWKQRANRVNSANKSISLGGGGKSAAAANRRKAAMSRKASVSFVTTPPTRGIVTPAAPTSFKVSGVNAVDAAAHLQLLGEALTVIGERLTEHEGRIAVSGSLSVLLDSMICSMAPLLCTLLLIPEFQISPSKKTKLETSVVQMLDHAAYIMPGL